MTPLQRRPGRRSPDSAGVDAFDRAMRGITINERCSFGTELRSELVEEYDRLRGAGDEPLPAPRGFRWTWAAAVLLVAGGVLSIPRTRGALLEPFRPGTPEIPASPDSVRLMVPVASTPAIRMLPAIDRSEELFDGDRARATIPVIADRSEARRVVAEEYPLQLQERGIGGTVEIVAWVNPEGGAELVQIDSSSGVAELDRAAVRVALAMRFLPATRLGEAVGTWVTLPIRFMPNATEAEPEPEAGSLRIPLSN